MSKIYVWIKDPGKAPRHVHISDSLKNLQRIVGGDFEQIAISTDASLLVNEDGKRLNLPYNMSFLTMDIVGTVIFVGTKGEDLVDFPIEKVDKMKRYFPELWRWRE